MPVTVLVLVSVRVSVFVFVPVSVFVLVPVLVTVLVPVLVSVLVLVLVPVVLHCFLSTCVCLSLFWDCSDSLQRTDAATASTQCGTPQPYEYAHTLSE